MQTLAILSKSTRQGESVWRFVKTEDGQYYAFGGVTPACKFFRNKQAMTACRNNYIKLYGYTDKTSQLPQQLQLELAAL